MMCTGLLLFFMWLLDAGHSKKQKAISFNGFFLLYDDDGPDGGS